ncbi:MAG TPA: nucleoside-diphosphate sugar epimerase/dehydratase [Methylocella sp.]|nr:nucleoside-diphosphate sugar epimerase/dehydratase [Methylocella sp.]
MFRADTLPAKHNGVFFLTNSIVIRRLGRLLIDVALSGFSFQLAMVLRLGVLPAANAEMPADVAVFASVCATVYLATGLSFRSWRFTSILDFFQMTRDITIAIATFLILSFLIGRLADIPRSVPLIACFIMITALGSIRVLYRRLIERTQPLEPNAFMQKELLGDEPAGLLVYGANAETEAFLRSLETRTARSYLAVGIIDDQRISRDWRIRGIKVLGGAADLPQIVSSFAMSSIKLKSLVLPASGLPRSQLRELVDAAAKSGLRPVRVPRACDLLRKANDAFAFEAIQVADLLGREPIALRLDSVDALIRGKSVVVTGGGGSIGSELCRQLLRYDPAKLVILDHSEFNLFKIQSELAAMGHRPAVHPVLASVRDKERIHAILAEAHADVIFHAAAYKHVPLVESNPIEGILTNVIGTANVAEAAVEVGAKAMVMISTDKAVKPSNTMGLSKRVAEAYCQAIDLECGEHDQCTRFLIVRFGNVLGSSGSVVPVFEEQIKNGGPVTVTDPAMTRYFMTIPEAVELVLQGSVFGLGDHERLGAVLVLEMGDPVPIVELARRMISLAGFVPEKDIPIEFTGIRDGEKLHEDLFDDREILETTAVPGIRVVRSPVESAPHMRDLRDRLLRAAPRGDAQLMVAMLRDSLAKLGAPSEPPCGGHAEHQRGVKGALYARAQLDREGMRRALC